MASFVPKLAILASVILQLFCSFAVSASSLSDETLLRSVGQQLYLRKNWPGARAVYQKLIEICPQDYFAHEKLVKIFLADGKAADAIGTAKQLVVMQPAEPEAHYLLGKCLDQTGNYQEALKEYKHAHTLCLDNLTYVIALMRIYRKIGCASDAVVLLKNTLQKNQQVSLLWAYLFETAVEAKNITLAHESLEHFCRLIRNEKNTEEPKQELITAGWHMIALDCWRASLYQDQMLLCYSLNETTPAVSLIEVAKIKFPDTPQVFAAFSQIVSCKAEANKSKEDLELWTKIKRSIKYIKKQAEVQKFAST